MWTGLDLLRIIPFFVMQAPGEFGDGKDNVPLNALENGCTPEDLCESPNPLWKALPSDSRNACRTALQHDLFRLTEDMAHVISRMMMQMTAQAMGTTWLTKDGQL